jgi:hypothetical protein
MIVNVAVKLEICNPCIFQTIMYSLNRASPGELTYGNQRLWSYLILFLFIMKTTSIWRSMKIVGWVRSFSTGRGIKPLNSIESNDFHLFQSKDAFLGMRPCVSYVKDHGSSHVIKGDSQGRGMPKFSRNTTSYIQYNNDFMGKDKWSNPMSPVYLF